MQVSIPTAPLTSVPSAKRFKDYSISRASRQIQSYMIVLGLPRAGAVFAELIFGIRRYHRALCVAKLHAHSHLP